MQQKVKRLPGVLNRDVDQMGFSLHVRNGCYKLRFRIVDDLLEAMVKKDPPLAVFGEKSLSEIKANLGQKGIDVVRFLADPAYAQRCRHRSIATSLPIRKN